MELVLVFYQCQIPEKILSGKNGYGDSLLDDHTFRSLYKSLAEAIDHLI